MLGLVTTNKLWFLKEGEKSSPVKTAILTLRRK
jgi:hypothetical protein